MFEKRVALSLKSASSGLGNEENLIAIGNAVTSYFIIFIHRPTFILNHLNEFQRKMDYSQLKG
jgi:hypothetical protein